MNNRANTSLIGAFVLGGALLFVACVSFFGSGAFSSKKTSFICFFEDSVNGLDLGSPVKFKGVTVGKVSKVLLRTDAQDSNDNAVPVIIEIDERHLSKRGVTEYIAGLSRQEAVVEKGLRARLQQQSVVTGLLFVDLDLHPGTPVVYHKKEPDLGIPELPTIASNFGTLVRAAAKTVEQLGQIQFVVMGEKVNRILTQVEMGVAAVDFKGINQGVLDATAAANALLRDPQVGQLPGNLNTTLVAIQDFSKKLEGRVDPLATEVQLTTIAVRQTLEQIDLAVANLRMLTQPGTGLRNSLEDTLRQIAEAAEAVRTLANYLERNPNVLVTGKHNKNTEPEPKLGVRQ